MDQRTISRLEWRRIFPWLWLFRTFRIALDYRKLLVGVLGLCFIAGGNHAIDLLKMQKNSDSSGQSTERTNHYPWEVADELLSGTGRIPSPDLESLEAVFSRWETVWRPMTIGAVQPVRTLVTGSDASFAQLVDAFLRILWFLLVWGIFGGALTRMAIFEFVKDERLGITTAIRFSVRKIIDFLSAPLVPIGGMICLLLVSALIGLLGRIPSAGPTIVAVLWFVPLILSIGIVIMLIGVGAGWPLMVAAISTEDSDGFDGFSRAHSYVFDVPWQYIWSLVVLLCYGSAVLYFLDAAGMWMFHFSALGLGWGMGELPESNAAWLLFVKSLLIAYRVSFFWCGFLMIYLVLRNVSDKKPFKDAFLEPLETEQPRAMALSGLSSTEGEITERPVIDPNAQSANLDSGRVSDAEDVSQTSTKREDPDAEKPASS